MPSSRLVEVGVVVEVGVKVEVGVEFEVGVEVEVRAEVVVGFGGVGVGAVLTFSVGWVGWLGGVVGLRFGE